MFGNRRFQNVPVRSGRFSYPLNHHSARPTVQVLFHVYRTRSVVFPFQQLSNLSFRQCDTHLQAFRYYGIHGRMIRCDRTDGIHQGHRQRRPVYDEDFQTDMALVRKLHAGTVRRRIPISRPFQREVRYETHIHRRSFNHESRSGNRSMNNMRRRYRMRRNTC